MTKPDSMDVPPRAEGTSAPSAKTASRPPTCFVVDRDSTHRHFMRLVLQGHGIETAGFPSASELGDAMARTHPDLICVDVAAVRASETVSLMASRGCRGTVQPMGTNPIPDFDLLQQVA